MKVEPVEIPEVLPAKRGPGRPPKVLDIVENRTLPERASKIVEYHQGAMMAAAQTAGYAILCGLELLAARAQIAHGKWEHWVESNCPFAPITAWRYMTAAEKKCKDMPNLSGRKDLFQTAPHLLCPADRKLLVDFVKDSVDQQTWTELQLELGLRTPDKTKGGAREGAGRPTNSEDTYQRKVAEAKVLWVGIEQQVNEQITKRSHKLLDKMTLTALAAAIRHVADELDHHLKSL